MKRLRLLGELLNAELAIAGVQQLHLEPTFAAEPAHGGGFAQHHHRPLHALHQLAVESLSHRRGGAVALTPIADPVQPHKKDSFIRAAVSEGAAGVEVCAAQGRFLRQGAAHFFHHRLGALEGGAIRQHHHAPQLTVVFLGDKGAGAQA